MARASDTYDPWASDTPDQTRRASDARVPRNGNLIRDAVRSRSGLPNLELGQAVKLFCDAKMAEGLSPRTVRWYADILERAVARFGAGAVLDEIGHRPGGPGSASSPGRSTTGTRTLPAASTWLLRPRSGRCAARSATTSGWAVTTRRSSWPHAKATDRRQAVATRSRAARTSATSAAGRDWRRSFSLPALRFRRGYRLADRGA